MGAWDAATLSGSDDSHSGGVVWRVASRSGLRMETETRRDGVVPPCARSGYGFPPEVACGNAHGHLNHGWTGEEGSEVHVVIIGDRNGQEWHSSREALPLEIDIGGLAEAASARVHR